jgi:hypothetical protein
MPLNIFRINVLGKWGKFPVSVQGSWQDLPAIKLASPLGSHAALNTSSFCLRTPAQWLQRSNLVHLSNEDAISC